MKKYASQLMLILLLSASLFSCASFNYLSLAKVGVQKVDFILEEDDSLLRDDSHPRFKTYRPALALVPGYLYKLIPYVFDQDGVIIPEACIDFTSIIVSSDNLSFSVLIHEKNEIYVSPTLETFRLFHGNEKLRLTISVASKPALSVTREYDIDWDNFYYYNYRFSTKSADMEIAEYRVNVGRPGIENPMLIVHDRVNKTLSLVKNHGIWIDADGRSGYDGENGADGRDEYVETVTETIKTASGPKTVTREVKRGPTSGTDGKSGWPGGDGGSIILRFLAESGLEKRCLLTASGGKGGKGGYGAWSGRDGKDGKDGRNGSIKLVPEPNLDNMFINVTEPGFDRNNLVGIPIVTR